MENFETLNRMRAATFFFFFFTEKGTEGVALMIEFS